MARQAVVQGYLPPISGPVYANESRILQAITTGGFLDQSAGAPVSVTPAARSLAISTSAPTVTIVANTTVTPSVAALAITGTTPTVTVSSPITITPLVGSLLITGTAPTVTAGALQLGLSIGDSLVCYTELTHVRAAMGQSGLDSILYTSP